MNRLVAQAFQPAGLPDFRVRWARNGRLESRPNPQARKPALRTRLGSWSQCAPNMTWRLSMNLKMLGLIPKTLRVSGSWAQSVVLRPGRLPMNRQAVARVANLPYRRLLIGEALERRTASGLATRHDTSGETTNSRHPHPCRLAV